VGGCVPTWGVEGIAWGGGFVFFCHLGGMDVMIFHGGERGGVGVVWARA